LIDNKIVLTDTVEVYDINTGQWELTRMSRARTNLAGAANGDFVFFGGGIAVSADLGLIPVSTVDRYSILTKTWSLFELTAPRYGLAATGSQGRVVFAGGYDNSSFAAQAEIFSSTTGVMQRSTISVARAFLSAGTAGTLMVFAGGLTANGPSDAVDIYDPDANQWRTARLSQPRYGMAVAADGDWIIFAGGTTTGDAASDRIDVFNARTGVWTSYALPKPLSGMAGAATRGRFIFSGGINGNTLSNSMYIYSIQ
jgi:N-acetylneuraminic acid mutarotase